MTSATSFSKGIRMPMIPVVLFVMTAFLSPPKAHAIVVTTCDAAHFRGAVSVGGSVSFSCSGVINIDSPVTIDRDTTIDGGGTAILDGGTSTGGLLFINCGETSGSFCTLDLMNITLQNSKDSAIYNSGGNLKASKATFINNHGGLGGAIHNTGVGKVTIEDCYFKLNSASVGGAISNEFAGALVVEFSTFYLNNAERGGAIFNGAFMDVYDCTFTDNGSITGQGGNIDDYSDQYLSYISNSTLSGGRGSPGNIHFAGSVDPQQGTQGLLVIHTIMANPGPSSSLATANCSGALIDGGGNLQWPATGSPCVGALADPKLGPLANNGGSTLTMALLPGSAAIDSWVVFCSGTDQRHILRPQGPHCDIGAYEFIPSTIQFIGALGGIMGDFAPSLPGTGAGKLTQQVLSPLSRSQDATLWQADGNHLNSQRGEQVFDLHQAIVNNLAELIVDQTQLDYISNLLFADRALAVAATAAANCGAVGAASPTNGKCAQAASELAKGDDSSAAGNYGDAINHYKSAWSDVASPSTHN